ncbi:hypothetical protein MKK75_10900 [Methylobacterium sp. J-030]|uniref:hypothetical protein n=1 Tax=Methylobacterium sp. J-030 TaxID=2836627 RepID=UPI001FB88FBC|nr:hypothetical protein [Methylobacterium sp. J-030]MCJ2069301.1 hypothetical protein [Methylobacterium sp. J-030]
MEPTPDAVELLDAPLPPPVPPVNPTAELPDVDKLVRPDTFRPVLTDESEPAGLAVVDELPAGFGTLPPPEPPPPKLKAPALVMPPVRLEIDGKLLPLKPPAFAIEPVGSTEALDRPTVPGVAGATLTLAIDGELVLVALCASAGPEAASRTATERRTRMAFTVGGCP